MDRNTETQEASPLFIRGLTNDEKRAIEELARKADRPVANWVRQLLRAAIAESKGEDAAK